jgi:hypothetical protein
MCPSNYRQDAQRIHPPRGPLRRIVAEHDAALVVCNIGIRGHFNDGQRLAGYSGHRAFLNRELRQREPR